MSEPPIPYATPTRHGVTARDLFGVIVRVFGLLITVWGLYTVMYAGLMQMATLPSGGTSVGDFLVFGGLLTGAGISLVRGEWLVRFAYGRPPEL